MLYIWDDFAIRKNGISRVKSQVYQSLKSRNIAYKIISPNNPDTFPDLNLPSKNMHKILLLEVAVNKINFYLLEKFIISKLDIYLINYDNFVLKNVLGLTNDTSFHATFHLLKLKVSKIGCISPWITQETLDLVDSSETHITNLQIGCDHLMIFSDEKTKLQRSGFKVLHNSGLGVHKLTTDLMIIYLQLLELPVISKLTIFREKISRPNVSPMLESILQHPKTHLILSEVSDNKLAKIYDNHDVMIIAGNEGFGFSGFEARSRNLSVFIDKKISHNLHEKSGMIPVNLHEVPSILSNLDSAELFKSTSKTKSLTKWEDFQNNFISWIE
jgi:hypothetical protein